MRSFDLLPDFTFQILLLQFLFELAKGGINRNPGGKNVDFGFDLSRAQRSIAIVIDVIDCRRQDFTFQALVTSGGVSECVPHSTSVSNDAARCALDPSPHERARQSAGSCG